MKFRIVALFVCALTLVTAFQAPVSADGDENGENAGFVYDGNCVYVSDSGDDSEDGLKDYPVRTLKRAYELLSNDVNTERASGGYLIIKDVLTIFNSEGGKIDKTADPERYDVDLSGIPHTHKITICGENADSKLVFANSFTSRVNYGSYQGYLRLSGAVEFENIQFVFNQGRVHFTGSDYIGFGENVSQSGSMDFYFHVSGTVCLKSGKISHLFAPVDNIDTNIILGGTAYVGGLWLGLGSFSKSLTVTFAEGAAAGKTYLGGQAKSFTGTTDIILAGGNPGSVGIYNKDYYKGKTRFLSCDPGITVPGISGKTAFVADQSDFAQISPRAAKAAVSYDAAILKARRIVNPAGIIEDGFAECSFYVKPVDKGGESEDFPLPLYSLRIPDKYLLSENFAVYAYYGGSFFNCSAEVCGRYLVFEPFDFSCVYTIAHKGSGAARDPEAPGDPFDAPEPEPFDPAGLNDHDGTVIIVPEDGGNGAPAPFGINATALIIAAIIAVTAIAEFFILFGKKNRDA